MTLSASAEDYLKAIYKESGSSSDGAVSTQALADRLGVTAPSATAAVKKLAGLNLVRHEPYRGVVLTETGEKIALEVIRHHRLVELFLEQVLGMDRDRVHAEAEKWEHVLSEEVEAHIDAALRSPTHDPHGAPIPTPDGIMPPDKRLRLLEAAASDSEVECCVRGVAGGSASEQAFLREVGIVPGARLQVLPCRAEEGVLRVQVSGPGGEQVLRVLGAHPASLVWVTREDEEEADER
jgi:DtxR family Mn-dependent transcriptional regulator